jgi:hypothetical protein
MEVQYVAIWSIVVHFMAEGEGVRSEQ